ncbi:MAG: ATP-binding cassette domain-containing protein [Thermotogota bacterium]|nr:ATP-binding cassette domain-containing protein [Thermotogota bacterium]
MIELENITLIRDKNVILEELSAEFDKDKVYAVLGNNGVGKSSLAYIIMGLEDYRNYKGTIKFNGKSIDNKDTYERAKLGITLGWQEPARYDGLTTREYLNLGGKINASQKKLKKTLEIVGLSEHYLDRPVDGSLSGGERKRIELASAILLKPKVVILDEPDSGIDLMSTDMIERVLNHLKNSGTTVILITHREEISYMADEAYLMCGGKIIAEGQVDEIVSFYRDMCDSCSHINEPNKGGELNK